MSKVVAQTSTNEAIMSAAEARCQPLVLGLGLK